MVTGALGYTGRYIAQKLLARGDRVRTVTGHPALPNPFGDRIEIAPMDFARPDTLAHSLEGAKTLFNTYWIRFPYDGMTFDTAVENTRVLLRAAVTAGVRRIVHISIASADERSPLPYFRGKGVVERAVVESGLSYLIVRPTLVFGGEDILINNVAWMLRRFPLFAIPGSGDYRVQPVFVEDVATLATTDPPEAGNRTVEAAGPETYTFRELVVAVAGAVRSRAFIVPSPPALALMAARLIGRAFADITLTRDEVEGLSAGLLISNAESACPTLFSEWLRKNSDRIGQSYNSEMARRTAPERR